jgi:uncharacterized protein (TIGR02391 family)
VTTWPPSEEELFSLPIDQLAVSLLQYFVRRKEGQVNRHNFGLPHVPAEFGYDTNRVRVQRRLVEIFDWLMFNGFVAEKPGESSGWSYITERGEALAADAQGLTRHRASSLLAHPLHHLIEQRVRSQFLLGEYEAAVLLAFREVEIRVRNLGQFDASMIGVNLMRQAFRPNGGTLTDAALDPGEQTAVMELFAGAIGAFKNPSSHRQVDYGDATVAAEAVLFADLLLRILDRYDPALQAASATATTT